MAINPALIDITTIPNLPTGAFTLGNYIAQSDGSGVMSKNTQSAFAAFIAPYVAAIGSAGYAPTSGLALPTPAGTNSFTFVGGPATYTHSGGNVNATGSFNILNWNGTAWSLAFGINIDLSGYATLTPSKNLFNKATITSGFYANYATGNLDALASFSASDFIKVNPSTQYTQSLYGVAVGDQIAFYDINKVHVGGLPSAYTFTTGATTQYVRINNILVNIDGAQLELGTSATPHVNFGSKINKSQIRGEVTDQDGVITVAKVGGDYQKIQDAVDASNGTLLSPDTIIIYPGVYKEKVNTVGKYVSLIGVNKRDCVILTDTGNYYNPPLECSGGIYAENLTFKATSDNPDVHSINAYAVHMDFIGPGVAEFFNCIMESHQNSAMGVGLHQDQTLIINSCHLNKLSDGAVYDGGSLYFHNSPAAESNQKLIVKYSHINTDKGVSLVIDDARANAGGSDINTTVTFFDNIFWSDEFGKGSTSYRMSNAPISGGISGKIKLTNESFGNNIAIINA